MIDTYSGTRSETLSENQKEKEDYLVSQTDAHISELVYDKDHLRKAYNYYQGERDKDQFRHLEENYGIGTPTSIEFIPLVRSHINVLIGEHLQNKLQPKVTCKDKETLNQINREKQIKIYEAEINKLKEQLAANLLYFLQSEEEKQAGQPPVDTATEERLKKLREDIERDFVSDYEISAQYVIQYLIQNKNVNLYDKLKLLFLDLLVAGQCYYKVSIDRLGETPIIEVLNPFDVFYEKNYNSALIKDSTRIVHRRWMNKQQIISKYGRYMTKTEIEELDSQLNIGDTHDVYYIRNCSGGLISNVGATVVGDYQRDDSQYKEMNIIPVYEVEWLANNKVTDANGKTDYRMDRYESVRIGQSIYIDMGKSDKVVRSVEAPYKCNLSINGISYDERNSKPYSLVLATANLQDKFDILHFYRDTLIASSGIKGDWLDVSQLPSFLGQSEAERIAKFIAYKKAGVALTDTSQEGRGANLNTIYAGFDDTVDGNAVQAIQFAIDATEATCSTITGVFRERIGGIEQRDAVTNVQVGIKQSAIITKQYFRMMDSITTELLIDSLNMCKLSFKEGKVGSLILGDKMQQIFTIEPDKFSFTDYDVHIDDSGDIIADMETIKMISMELVKTGSIDVDVVLEGITSKSLTEMKENVIKSYRRKLEENNQLNQAAQQIEQLQQQLQQIQAEAKKLGSENESLKKQSDELKQRELQIKYEIEKERNRIADEFNKGKLEIDEKKVSLEELQLYDNNPYNNKVNFDS